MTRTVTRCSLAMTDSAGQRLPANKSTCLALLNITLYSFCHSSQSIRETKDMWRNIFRNILLGIGINQHHQGPGLLCTDPAAACHNPQPAGHQLSAMLLSNELWRLSAVQVHGLISEGSITVTQYAHSLLSRIDVRDGIVKAWAYLGPLSSRWVIVS